MATIKEESPLSFMSMTHASPEQMRRRKIVKKGFQLCLMVCGHSGTGKSTFINTLCEGQVFSGSRPKPTHDIDIRTHQVELGEADGTTISLTVVDTPGFGENINNDHCCDKIVRYVEKQFDEILSEEQRVKRNPRFRDNRVHVALYFIAPTGHGLRELDIDFMMTLSSRVNVIPVVAKADSLTTKELAINKRAIMDDIRHFRIPIYYFPCDSSDQESIEECTALRNLVPFAVVGSNNLYKVDGKLVRGRMYPWGVVKVEDPDHSDFSVLRSVIFGSHLQELRDLTHEVIYERYRTSKLSELADEEDMSGPCQSSVTNAPAALYSEYKRLQQQGDEMQHKIDEKRRELAKRVEQLQELEQGYPNY